MKVLSVGSLPPEWGGAASGGVATFHARLIEGLLASERGLDVVGVVAPGGDRAPVPVINKPNGQNTGAFYESVLERLRPDAVILNHFANAFGVKHARLTDPPPAIGVAHSWHAITFRSGSDRERAREKTEEALAGLNAMVGGSHHCLREGLALGLRYPGTAEVIHHPLGAPYASNGVDVDAAERRGVLYLGGLVERKQPAALVRAAAQHPGLEVFLGGAGELEESLCSLIRELSLTDRVRIEHLSATAAHSALLRSEVMCLPSRSESFGLAYTEALACGTPVVGFAPTLREIEERVGIPIGEALDGDAPEEIAAAIERVRAARWNRAELRRRTLEEFDLGRTTDRYVELIERVVAEAPRKHP